MYARTKHSGPPTQTQIYIDRLRFVLGVVAILAIAITFILGQVESNAINSRVTRIESPCLRYGPRSDQCRETFSAAIKSITPYQLCILLEKRPGPTATSPAQCVRIARQAKAAQQAAENSDAHSPGGSSPSSPPDNQADTHSAPPGSGAGATRSPAHSPSHTPAAPQHAPSPESPGGTPTTPPAATHPTHPSHPQPPTPAGPGPAPGNGNSSASPPSVVGIKAPILPVHVCTPGVGVNCP